MSWDAIVIGSGHNGLVAALRLARAGRRVLVLERREAPGGVCAGEEFHPGYTAPGLLHDTTGLRPAIAQRLGLEAAGLAFRDPAPAWLPRTDGPPVPLHREAEQAAAELAMLAPGDAKGYRSWRSFLAAVTPPVRALLDAEPPPLSPRSPGDLLGLARRGLSLRRLGRRTMLELLRVIPMPVADWLGETFASPLLVEALAAPALVGTWLGPRSPGSAGNLLLLECAAGRAVAGGPAGLVSALRAACATQRVEVRCGAPVRALLLAAGQDGEQAAGVELDDGETLAAPLVLASCDPRSALLGLVPRGRLPTRLEEALRNFRCRGSTAVVRLALAGPLELAGCPGETPEHVRVGGGHPDALERAFDAAKYGRLPARPHLEVAVPTVADPGLAPPGHHVATILVSPVPPAPVGGWTDVAREQLGETAVATLAGCAPGLRERIVARQVLAPADLAARFGLPGGHLHHGEHALDQLASLRPAPSVARYRTPVRGYYLAGSGSHPGGGVTGMPGWLAAGAALADA